MITAAIADSTSISFFVMTSSGHTLPKIFERQLAIVLAQKIQEPLVFVRLEIEHARHELVVASRFLEAAADELADIAARDFALHVERIDDRPERLSLLSELSVQLIRNRLSSFALRSEAEAALRPNLRRQVVSRYDFARSANNQSLEDVLQLPHVAWPGVLDEQLVGIR